LARISASLACLALLTAGLASAAPEQGTLDYNPVLFTVMAAFDVAKATPQNMPADPLRAAVRQEILKRNPACLKDMRSWFFQHRKDDPAADLGQYVSWALAIDPPPRFTPRLIGMDVPPDAQALSGLAPLMATFWEQANMEDIYKQVQPAYERALAQFQPLIARTVLEANGYTRNPTSGYMGRRFQVFVELLAPSSQVHTRSIKDDYFVVVTPPAEAHMDDVRHAYLHYLIDPLATKFSERFIRVRGLIDYAQAAPALDDLYKDDFLLLGIESLIKSVEARMARQPSKAQEAIAEGFVLTPYFSEALPAYEKQEVALRMYLPEMLDAIDLRKEDKRLQGIQFAKTKVVRMAAPVAKPAEPQKTPQEIALENADKLYTGRDLDLAREAYLKIVRVFDDTPTKCRGYFGLARVAALKNEPESAEQLFRKTLELSPDAYTRSWSEVYLGRLAEGYGEKEKATQHYKTALAVEGAPPGARQAADQGVQKLTPR